MIFYFLCNAISVSALWVYSRFHLYFVIISQEGINSIMARNPPPISHLIFVSKDSLKDKWLTFHAMEKDDPYDPTSRTLVVLPERSGCVMLAYDPRPGGDSAVIVQSVKHDRECALEGLPRKYGTRAMILGSINLLKYLALDLKRYTHLKELVLDDEARYHCPPLSDFEGGKIRTFATDLLLSGQTYYERHLHVRPSKPLIADIVTSVKRRMEGHIDVPFLEFWEVLTAKHSVKNDIPRNARLVEWLKKRESEVMEMYEKAGEGSSCWRDFFGEVHTRWGCTFFTCCWWRLCVLFGMTRLAGACWTVAFARIPKHEFQIRQMGGGKPSAVAAGTMEKRATKEIREATRKRVTRAERT